MEDRDREGSVDAISSYKNRGGTQGRNNREGSEGKLYNENSYLTAQVERGASIGVNEYQNDGLSINGQTAAQSQISPRNQAPTSNKNIDKMNVINFIKQQKTGMVDSEYQKAINR